MKTYDPTTNLKYKFPGLNVIKENYSQTYQDMFVLTMLNGKQHGKFLEIGAQEEGSIKQNEDFNKKYTRKQKCKSKKL